MHNKSTSLTNESTCPGRQEVGFFSPLKHAQWSVKFHLRPGLDFILIDSHSFDFIGEMVWIGFFLEFMLLFQSYHNLEEGDT